MNDCVPPRPQCTTRVDAKPHVCSWWHAGLVDGFRAAQRAQETRAELHTGGYDTELAAYFGVDGIEKRLTFRDWLIGNRQECSDG